MHNGSVKIEVIGKADCLWQYTVLESGFTVRIEPPVFELDGQLRTAQLSGPVHVGVPVELGNGAIETVCRGTLAELPEVDLELVFRLPKENPVVRFMYRLISRQPVTLTKSGGVERLNYLAIACKHLPRRLEVRFSEFDETVHSFRPAETVIPESSFANSLAVMGPMVVASNTTHAMLVAYEHGSQVPDVFLQYRLLPDGRITLSAVKGNYWNGRVIDGTAAFETVWMQLAAVSGGENELACAYREFMLRYLTQNLESRKPYIFYNTWAYQERNKWWNGGKYLDSMNQARMLAEIDVAHRMGIDVFVLDTGWYDKTGDWRVNTAFFPDSLKAIKAKLDGYNMKLGLWFSPTQAAVSSRIMRTMPECRMQWDGKFQGPYEVWETEASYNFCLVSRYWEAFADELIRLVKEVGVTYFKWDAVGQYGCNCPDHWHGGKESPAAERADCYAFEQVKYMNRVVDKLCAACPEAIVDFDITEGGRSVGLAFLAAGKYFLINNGPYFPNLDIKYDWTTATTWSNVYVNPGPARPRVCRAPLDFDKWLPSVLFLTHYLPDDPAESQLINIASLILGQNGIWGDLLAVSPEGVSRFGELLGLYKQVREDVTGAAPVRQGILGGSLELHEKISALTGRGVVAAFAATAGTHTYVTQHKAEDACWCTPGTTVRHDAAGRALVTFAFARPGAQLAFFGVS